MFSNPTNTVTGGRLDRDCIPFDEPNCGQVGTSAGCNQPICRRVENTCWPNANTPLGRYSVNIVDRSAFGVPASHWPVPMTLIIRTSSGFYETCSATYTTSSQSTLTVSFDLGPGGTVSNMTGCDGLSAVGSRGGGTTGVWWINNGFPRGRQRVQIGRGNYSGYRQPDRISTRINCCGSR